MAKASGRKDPEALPVGSDGQLRESKRRARPSQALIVRLVPSGVNGSRPRLNRLSKMGFCELRGLALKLGAYLGSWGCFLDGRKR